MQDAVALVVFGVIIVLVIVSLFRTGGSGGC